MPGRCRAPPAAGPALPLPAPTHSCSSGPRRTPGALVRFGAQVPETRQVRAEPVRMKAVRGPAVGLRMRMTKPKNPGSERTPHEETSRRRAPVAAPHRSRGHRRHGHPCLRLGRAGTVVARAHHRRRLRRHRRAEQLLRLRRAHARLAAERPGARACPTATAWRPACPARARSSSTSRPAAASPC